MKVLSSLLLSSLFLSSAANAQVSLAVRDLVPVKVVVDSFGSGEFPQMHGRLYVKNIGNSPVTYKGPDNCQPNPFGGAPMCDDTTLHMINSLGLTVYNSSSIEFAPGETVALDFSSYSTDTNIKHCGTARVTIDTKRQFNQVKLVLAGNPNVYVNDSAVVRTLLAWNRTACLILPN